MNLYKRSQTKKEETDDEGSEEIDRVSQNNEIALSAKQLTEFSKIALKNGGNLDLKSSDNSLMAFKTSYDKFYLEFRNKLVNEFLVLREEYMAENDKKVAFLFRIFRSKMQIMTDSKTTCQGTSKSTN